VIKHGSGYEVNSTRARSGAEKAITENLLETCLNGQITQSLSGAGLKRPKSMTESPETNAFELKSEVWMTLVHGANGMGSSVMNSPLPKMTPLFCTMLKWPA
jgi:hypothetical protein